MKNQQFNVKSAQVIHHVGQSSCSSYNCEFINLAKDLDINLITLDKQLLREFSDIAIHPEKVIDHFNCLLLKYIYSLLLEKWKTNYKLCSLIAARFQRLPAESVLPEQTGLAGLQLLV